MEMWGITPRILNLGTIRKYQLHAPGPFLQYEVENRKLGASAEN
jgi:hypothetical protein